MMTKRITAFLISALLVMGGCSSGSPQVQQSPAPQTDQETDLPSVSDRPSDSGGSTSTLPAEAPSAPPEENQELENVPASEDLPAEEPVPPKVQYRMNQAYRIVPNDEQAEEKVVLLTFDDGPKDKEMVTQLLDILDKHEAKAIFFVNGYRVKDNPELLKLIHERGQVVGNHSWDHIDLKAEDEAGARKQIEDVQQIVEETIGTAPVFFRPPFGSGGETVKRIAEENGLLYMTWSNGSLDWDSKNKNNPDGVIQDVMEQLHPGSNILMHELPWTVNALDKLLTGLKEKGYSFVDPLAIETVK